MSLTSIFALFGFPGDNGDEDKKIEKDFNAYKKTPHFKIGMFHKLIVNGMFFKKQILKFFSKSDPELDMEGVDNTGEYMMYTRAYYWIQDFKFKSKNWKEALKDYSNDEFLSSIKLSIHYFEEVEEYEKCAHLKKIQDLIEKNLALD